MNRFERICRDLGLFLHNLRRPDHEKRVIRHETTEEHRGQVTLRRTTIEEVEFDESDQLNDRRT